MDASLNTSTAFAVTPSDTVLNECSALYVGGTGDVAVEPARGPVDASVVFKAVPVGTVLPIKVRRIYSTNTTATLIIGLG